MRTHTHTVRTVEQSPATHHGEPNPAQEEGRGQGQAGPREGEGRGREVEGTQQEAWENNLQ